MAEVGRAAYCSGLALPSPHPDPMTLRPTARSRPAAAPFRPAAPMLATGLALLLATPLAAQTALDAVEAHATSAMRAWGAHG